MSSTLASHHVPRLALVFGTAILTGLGSLAGPSAWAERPTSPPAVVRVRQATVEVTRRIPGAKARAVVFVLGVAGPSHSARGRISSRGLNCRVALGLRPARDHTLVADLDLAWQERHGLRQTPNRGNKAARHARVRTTRLEANLSARLAPGKRVLLGRIKGADGSILEVRLTLK